MRWTITLSALCTLTALSGCEKADPDFKPSGPVNLSHREMNEAMIDSYNLRSQDDAIIRQHTIYPYHFVNNSAELNALGRREVYVLAHHFRNNPGPLNLHQGDANAPLYQARIKTVMDSMVNAGVASDRLVITDVMPGGDGLSSDQVVIVLERMNTATLTGASAPTSSSTSSSDVDTPMNSPDAPRSN